MLIPLGGGGGGGGLLPSSRVMVCVTGWGSHIHDWIGNYGVAFS